ncbi:DUF1963 domain-containing protein [Methylopila henanensis]|uniref:DUF1963 domain-containing protein n=1 Tax=Methylopila henanensis TaxID=873516 RepID=A0ABW4K5C2_9HYPH
MPKATCPEFSVEFSDLFPTVRVVGTSIGARAAVETATSPQMSVWTDATDRRRVAAALTAITKDLGKVVERRPVSVAGLTGEFVDCQDKLKDWDTGKTVPWRRLRVMLEGLDGGGRLHATAMCAKADHPEVSAAFFQMLDSVTFLAAGAEAEAARDAGAAEADALLAFARERMEDAATAAAARTAAADEAGVTGPVADAETRFRDALKAGGFARLRTRLRPLAAPGLLLVETADHGEPALGRTRVGGGPDLPDEAPWPRDASGLHLNFLAQTDLAALPSPRPGALPDSGLLSFFSGVDLSEGLVLHAPAGAALTHRPLPDDAAATAETAARMIAWSSDEGRFTLTVPALDGLEGATDADGRISFSRGGAPVVALASEHEIGVRPRALRIEPTLALPLADDRYAAAGVANPFPLWSAVRDGMAVGDGPQHQMFGLLGSEAQGDASPAGVAASRARKAGWEDLAAAPDGWFVLLALRSGGGAGFEFWDHGSVVFMAHAADTARGDFSRTVMYVEST